MRRSFVACLAALAVVATPAVTAEVPAGTMLDAEKAKPWHGVGRVNIGGLSTRGLCTGTLIAPDVVLTAAHCVVQARTGKPYRPGSIYFVAGWYKGEMTGHSVAASLIVHPFYRPGERSTVFDMGTDVALIRLANPIPADAASPFQVAAPPDPGAPLVVVSYRRDRPNALTYQEDCAYMDRDGPVLTILGCEVTTGASGSPVFAEIDGEEREVAVMVGVNNHGDVPHAYAIEADAAVRNLLHELPPAEAAPAGDDGGGDQTGP